MKFVISHHPLIRLDIPRTIYTLKQSIYQWENMIAVPQGQKISGAYDSLNHMMEENFSLSVGDVLADDLLDRHRRCLLPPHSPPAGSACISTRLLHADLARE